MKNVVVAGKGSLAVKACEWFNLSSDYDLREVIPVIPEPSWDSSLSRWGEESNVSVVKVGDYRSMETSNVDLFVSVFSEKI